MDKRVVGGIAGFIALLALIGAGSFAVNKLFNQKKSDCQKVFGIKRNIGCLETASCVGGADLTKEHDCQDSSDGLCPVTLGTYIGAQKFINIFNNLAKGKCALKVSSALQIKPGINPKTGKPYSPSKSSCHHVNTDQSGTCIDFNVTPQTQACFDIFYKAAKDSGTVYSYVNEYIPACYQTTQTGGNIHTNFGGETSAPSQKATLVSKEDIICRFEKNDLWSPQVPWDGSYICRGFFVFDFHGLTLKDGRTFMLKLNPQPEYSDFSSYDAQANVPINQATFQYSQVGGDYFQTNQPPCPAAKLSGTLTLFEAVPDIQNPFPAQDFNIDIPVFCK